MPARLLLPGGIGNAHALPRWRLGRDDLAHDCRLHGALPAWNLHQRKRERRNEPGGRVHPLRARECQQLLLDTRVRPLWRRLLCGLDGPRYV